MEIPADKDTYCAEKHIFHLPGQRGDPLCWVKWNVWFQLLSVVRLCTNFDEKKEQSDFTFFVLFKKKKCKVGLFGSHHALICCVKASSIVRASHWRASWRLFLAFTERTELFTAARRQVDLVAKGGLDYR